MQQLVQEQLPKLKQEVTEEEPLADVAFIFDYTSFWVWQIEPYSGSWDVKSAGYTDAAVSYLDLIYIFYSALRRLGLSIDVIGPDQSLDVAQIASLPAIVFRCIQYLEAKKAEQEEGIYRLSGSSAVIKSLKDRFNAGAVCVCSMPRTHPEIDIVCP